MSSTSLTLAATAAPAPARVAAAVAIGVSVLCLVGWLLGAYTLTSIIPGAVQMKVNTAVCILLCGIGLMMLTYRTSAGLEVLARAMALLALIVGAATLGEYLFDWQLGIDELLGRDANSTFGVFRGRMSPFSAVAFMVVGFAVAGLRLRYLDRAARIAACLGLAIGMVSLLGYFWNAGDLTTDRWLPPIAFNTDVCFIAIGAGVLLTRRLEADTRPHIALGGVEFKILAGFTAAISLLVLGGSFTYRAGEELALSVERIAHTQQVRTVLSDIYGSLAGANVAARDYFGTGEPSRLEEYRRLVDGERAHLSELTGLVSDNPAQRDNALRLSRLVEAQLTGLDQTMTAFNDYGLKAARAVLTLSRGKSTITQVGMAVAQMDAIERQLMEHREARAAKFRLTTLTSLLVTVAAAIALFITLFRGVHREMLARRAAEEALRDSDRYNRSIIESSPDCVCVLTTGAQITQMTPQGMRLMGIADFDAVAGLDWCLFWSGEDRSAARDAIAMARDGQPGRFSGMTEQGGTTKHWDVIVMPILSADGETERLLAVARDITEVKRSESNLLAANRFLDSLIDSLPVMVTVTDAQSMRFVRTNRMVGELLGVPTAQIVGKTAHELLPPEEAELTRESDQEALAGGKLVDITERLFTTRDGVKVLNTKKVAIRDEDGTAQYLLAISTDITASKLSEQAIRELNAQLEGKAAQLEATNKELESFSYSVSHDLRAPLRAIDGFAEILAEDYVGQLDAEALRYLAVIRDNSKRMGLLIDDLLAFSRLGRQAVIKSEVNVETLVREVIEEVLHAETLRAAGKPLPRFEVGELPAAHGDRALLRQVWINLIANAVKYSSKSPNPHIRISGQAAAAENQYSVRDNGVGFNMAYAEKLFGVFQRLHRADEFVGTGVGLAIVARVVKRHGGRVWAEGRVNEGAVFSFALPRGNSSG